MAINQIPTGAIQDSAITTEKVGNGEIHNVDLAANTITHEKIADGTINSDKIDETIASKGSAIALSIALG